MNQPLVNRRQFNRYALAGLGSIGLGSRAWGQEAKPPLSQPAQSQPAQTQPVRNDYGDIFANDSVPFVAGSFTIVALPDTQKYSMRWHEHFPRMTTWIKENKEKRNIQFVCGLGDITQNNVPEQWDVAKKSLSILDGQVPYSVICGNHDHGPNGGCATRETLLNDYFSVADQRKHSLLAGVMDEKQLENNYHTFSVHGRDYLVLGLEYGPRSDTIAWANKIVADHPKHQALLTTHVYMYYDDTRYDFAKYQTKQQWSPHVYPIAKGPTGDVNDGQELWDKLVSKHKNFFMTLNGHVLEDGLGQLTSQGEHGNDVHQLLVNYQNRWEGGEGYMRLIEFHPDGQTVQVKAYSPSTQKYKVDAQNQFTLKLSPPV